MYFPAPLVGTPKMLCGIVVVSFCFPLLIRLYSESTPFPLDSCRNLLNCQRGSLPAMFPLSLATRYADDLESLSGGSRKRRILPARLFQSLLFLGWKSFQKKENRLAKGVAQSDLWRQQYYHCLYDLLLRQQLIWADVRWCADWPSYRFSVPWICENLALAI